MDEKKAAKATPLIISIIVFSLSMQNTPDWSAVGIFTECRLVNRLSYPFYHAGILHSLLNAWCLLSVTFIYNISLLRLITAYIVAVSVPQFCLCSTPTVGLSGLVFALFGSISFEVERKLYYQLWMLTYLVIGFLFPNTNASIHLYCYIAGCMIALLNKPIKINKL